MLLAEEENLHLNNAQPLSGGDINEVQRLSCKEGEFVVKINDRSAYPKMFEREASGLDELRKAKSFKIPEVIATGELGENSYLLMRYIDANSPSSDFDEQFAQKLAKMHQVSADHFGFHEDNYIGKLPQYNDHKAKASDFYIDQRLEPQVKMAHNCGFDLPLNDRFFNNVEDAIPDEPSSLIHGDLWVGNYMTDEQGDPVLIDPATCYAHREMDLAMMKLFGGYSARIFAIYHEHYPLESQWHSRVNLYQLYYLLVHLNLFGAGYLSSVENIIKKYR
jgi:hypothetical protein